MIGQLANYSILNVFECPAYAHIQSTERSNFDPMPSQGSACSSDIKRE